jgi:hypothetical protein
MTLEEMRIELEWMRHDPEIGIHELTAYRQKIADREAAEAAGPYRGIVLAYQWVNRVLTLFGGGAG